MNKIKKKLLKYSASTIFEDNEELEFDTFSNFGGRIFSENGSLGWRPKVDLFETNSHLIVILDISNIEIEKIEILFRGENLVIRGFRKECDEQNKSHYYKLEIDFGPFERIISLPIKIDKNNFTKEYKNGFFKIKLKKKG